MGWWGGYSMYHGFMERDNRPVHHSRRDDLGRSPVLGGHSPDQARLCDLRCGRFYRSAGGQMHQSTSQTGLKGRLDLVSRSPQ